MTGEEDLPAEVIDAAAERFRRARAAEGRNERIDDPDALAVLASALGSVPS